MTWRRVVWWLAGMAAVLAAAAMIRSRFGVGWTEAAPVLGWIDLVAAAALVTAGALHERLRAPAVPWTAGVIWLLPDVAGVRGVSGGHAAILESTSWALPSLVVLTWLTAAGISLFGRAAALMALGSLLGIIVRIFVTNPFLDVDCWRSCYDNPFAVGAPVSVATGLSWIAGGLIAVGAAVGLVDARARRHLLPAVLAGTGGLALLLALVAGTAEPDTGWAHMLHAAAGISAAWLSLWLIADEAGEIALRRRLAELIVDLGHAPAPGRFAEAFREVIVDPDLEVGYWIPGRADLADADGRSLGDPLAPRVRTTTVSRSGRRLALLIHSRDVDPLAVARALGPGMRLALENDQLRAAQLAELHEVDESRRRILEHSHEERRRLERNLHDGAQQRVVSLLLTLRMLSTRLAGPDEAATARAGGLVSDLLEQLRRIARGIHPAVVADAGLAGALLDLAEHSTDVPVVVQVPDELGLSPLAQETAYEFVATALADARARSASYFEVASSVVEGATALCVEHDARHSPETDDLDGVAVHVEALAGHLGVAGAPGGWLLRMELPCGS